MTEHTAEAGPARADVGPDGAVRFGPRAPAAAGGRAVATCAAVAVLALCGGPAAGDAQELPEGVTPEMVKQGRQLFRGDAFCYTCHGRDGSGMSGAGGDLTDREWRHGEGSYEGIVERIRQGVRANASSTGVPMPPGGGARLSPEQLRAVAAYVWTLSRGGG